MALNCIRTTEKHSDEEKKIMSKKVIKNKTKKCTGCGSEAGLLLVTLPSNIFLRPRTKKETAWIKSLHKTKMMKFEHLRADKIKRRVKYCPECIKPLQKKFGTDQDGKPVPVNMWGQRSK